MLIAHLKMHCFFGHIYFVRSEEVVAKPQNKENCRFCTYCSALLNTLHLEKAEPRGKAQDEHPQLAVLPIAQAISKFFGRFFK